MSLILDALRKSEAERRRGQAPDLLSDVAPATPQVRAGSRDRGTVIALVVAAVLVLLLVAWWLRPAATAPAGAAGATVATHAPTMATTPAVATGASPAAEPARPPAPLSPPPPANVSPASTRVASAADPGPAAARAAADVTAAPAPPPAPSPPLPAPAAEPARAALPAFASADVPLRLGDLGSDERNQLPALKVSMHMWAPDAAHRFAIIDGTRVNEGDRVGEATVEAILQDGVMLAWRGRRIRLPIR